MGQLPNPETADGAALGEIAATENVTKAVSLIFTSKRDKAPDWISDRRSLI
jgi:hypothetical protein